MKKPNNTKLKINEKIYFIYEPKIESLSIELLIILSKDIEEFTMNDDGSKFKDKLSKFDVSRDKKFGDKWDFKVNKDSLEIIKEVINYYFNKEWVIRNGI